MFKAVEFFFLRDLKHVAVSLYSERTDLHPWGSCHLFCFLAENLLGALLRIKEVIRRRVESSEDEDTDERGMTQRLEDILRESSGERKKFRPTCAWQKISDQIFRSFWLRRSKVKIQTLDFPSCCNCIWLRLFFPSVFVIFIQNCFWCWFVFFFFLFFFYPTFSIYFYANLRAFSRRADQRLCAENFGGQCGRSEPAERAPAGGRRYSGVKSQHLLLLIFSPSSLRAPAPTDRPDLTWPEEAPLHLHLHPVNMVT